MKTALDYAKMAIDTVIKQNDPENIGPKGIFSYPVGVFLSGVEKVCEVRWDESYYVYLKKWVDIQLAQLELITKEQGYDFISSLDFRRSATLLFGLYEKTGEERYRCALTGLVESLKNYPINELGGFWHTKRDANEMWLDGLYMAGPLCAMYGALSDKQEYYEIAVNQAVIMWEHARDEETGLLRHGWDSTCKARWANPLTGMSEEVWGRALGWYAVALCDMLDYLPQNYKERIRLEQILNSFLKSVISYQAEDGRWYQVVDKPGEEGNWLENSCSCLLVYAIAKAVQKGYLEKEYREYAQKGYQGVIDTLQFGKEGELLLGEICIGTCIDSGDYEHYCSRERCVNDLHGTGAFILMTAQMSEINGGVI